MVNKNRCSKCGKYMTVADASDLYPGLCHRCQTARRAKMTRLFIVFICLLWIAIIATIVPIIANASPFVSEYYVSGMNLDTNERVVGYLTGELGSQDVGGVVYDRGDRWTVVGVLKGDVFYLRSLCCRYQCMYVQEVSANKLRNRLGDVK